MSKILGLDIGTNSIGWAVIQNREFGKEGAILGLGSRIIPMDGNSMQKFESGNTVSKTADRRMARTARRMKQRFKLRRTRLLQTLKLLGWIPADFPTDFKSAQDFSMRNFLPFDASTIKEVEETFGSNQIPEDWIVYYLRYKALTQKISLAELSRIIYMMNQRRGFQSSRKDQKKEDDGEGKINYPIYEKWVQILQVERINILSEEKGTKLLEIKAGGITGQIKRKIVPDWAGKEKELEITKKTIKSGEVTYTFSIPDPSDWEKKKVALEDSIHGSGYEVGEYFFHQLVQDRNYRIRQRIIDRSLYKKEFKAIWQAQQQFHPELQDVSRMKEIAQLLYKNNLAKQQELTANDLFHLFFDDIIYFQRPLRSQKHLISLCSLESKTGKDGKNYGIRVAPKSSPAFQEFRIWQTVHSLRVLELFVESDGKPLLDTDRTEEFLTGDVKARLFELFDSREKVKTESILKELKLNKNQYRLNYPSDKEFPGNETKAAFRKVFKKHLFEEGEILLNDAASLQKLWHMLYSLEDADEIVSALNNPKNGLKLPDEVIKHLSKLAAFPKQYAAYSTKAINKLLTLIRCGKFYDESAIPLAVAERLQKILDGEFDEQINDELREKIAQKNFTSLSDFQGLEVWFACYCCYPDRKLKNNTGKYEHPDDINIMQLIPSNSLRNPIVEQIIKECLSLVKDIWKTHGQPDEIHIELARELKKTADERKQLDDKNKSNEADRKRIRAILREIQNANPDSPADIERLRLWESSGTTASFENAMKFSKEPTKAEIEKYKLWGEQHHISPYTGKVIPLSKLFSPEYEIEHIIPRSRYFDDSFANKIICESYVNKFKDKLTARQLIDNHGGRTITHNGSTFTLLDGDAYFANCKQMFRGSKYNNFVREDIPKDFIQRQINDTRHITRKLAELLYPVAKRDNGIIFTIGTITNELKEKWGLNRVWKQILLPRFERLESITGESYIELDPARNNVRFKKDYKRVDHRHHALDALVIAATSREHIRYLNTLNAAEETSKLRHLVNSRYSDFILPWGSFTKEAREKLQEVIVSHKNRNRLVSKGVNKYQKWVQTSDGRWVKQVVRQQGELTSVRKSMFKEPLGRITLREYKDVSLKQALIVQIEALQSADRRMMPQIAEQALRNQISSLIKNCAFDLKETENHLKKHPLQDTNGETISKLRIVVFKEYAAKRVSLDTSFTMDKILHKIPNAQHSWLAKLLAAHLEEYGGDPNLAFKGEALDQLHKKAGKPVSKVTIYEEIGSKIPLGHKLVEGDKGTNLFYVIYEHAETKERIITDKSTIPLLEAIEKLTGKNPVADSKPGYRPIILSPNDLVYVPEPGESVETINWHDHSRIHGRIYKVVSFSKNQCFFVPHYISRPLDENGRELGSNNKSERAWDGQMIKNVCIRIAVDRLGHIMEANGRKITGAVPMEEKTKARQ